MKKLYIALILAIIVSLSLIIAYNLLPKKRRVFVNETVSPTGARIKVFGTEYVPNDEGRVFLQLLDENYQPIDDGACLLYLYYPNRTIWFDSALMMYQEDSKGLYYFDFIVPNITGVYMVTVECLYVLDEQIDTSDDFDLVYGTVVSGDYTDTWYEDGHYHWVRESWDDRYRLEIYYDFKNITQPDNYNGMSIVWKGNFDQRNEYIEIYIYDWCNTSWVNLPNRISYYTPIVTNYISNETIPFDCLVNEGGDLRVKFKDSVPDLTRSNLRTDLLRVEAFYTVYGQVNYIRGGGEVHVSKLHQLVTSNVTVSPSAQILT